jgi:methylisocitrate lyase
MCDRAREITEHTSLPLIVDGNAGFGDPAHTYRAVNAYAKAGISGMHIEDQVYPKRLHYHAGIKHTIEEDEMVKKVEAAVQSREDHGEDIVIIARTDTARDNRRETETIEDAVDRVNTYLDAGADAGMLFPASEEELQFAADNVDGPMVFTMVEGRDPHPTTEELNEMGVGCTLYALSATVAAAQRVHQMYSDLAETGYTNLDEDEFNEYSEFVEERIELPKYYDIEASSGKK